jgi:hypothetical protein
MDHFGHFEKGAWVETPTDKFLESCAAFGESMAEPFQNLGTKLCNSLNEPTDTFRNGRALSLYEIMDELYSKIEIGNDKGA